MTSTADKPKRPILRYHGGKWRLAPWIIDRFPPHRIYVEPFGGGASVLLQKDRSTAEIYNDLDGEIVNVFRILRDRPTELIRLLELTPYARAEFDLSMRPSDDPMEQARRTVARSFMSYGTSFTRRNRDGSPQRAGFRCLCRDASTAAQDWMNLPSAMAAIAARLRGVVIENRDAGAVLLANDTEQTLHYVDPPYVQSTRSAFTSASHAGYRFELTDEDHEQLAAILRSLKGTVILSGYPSALYDRLYADWERSEIDVFAVNAAPRKEVIWKNRRHPAELWDLVEQSADAGGEA